MLKPHAFDNPAGTIELQTVIFALRHGELYVLCVGDGARIGLPHGPFEPHLYKTLEKNVRHQVQTQTALNLEHVEQLYSFGDALRLDSNDRREHAFRLSVCYLGLSRAAATLPDSRAFWCRVYDFFPWEDWRNGEPAILQNDLGRLLAQQLGQGNSANEQAKRLYHAWGIHAIGWQEELVLERFEWLYSAGFVQEAHCDRNRRNPFPPHGRSMRGDHRRILATALGRLRGKLKYRPVLFLMAPAFFSLSSLQQASEAIVGFRMHKQNFRRAIAALVEPTDKIGTAPQGRPPRLYRCRASVALDRASAGISLPRLRARPSFATTP